MPRSTAVFYISGHGFGHASRDIEVINALRDRAPGLDVAVRTSAEPWLFNLTLRTPAEVHPLTCDTGVVQSDSLHLDQAATIRAAWAFQRQLPALARREAAWLRAHHAVVVVGDIPPLAFAAAQVAGLPSIGLGNFTWDRIYEAYPETAALAPDLGASIRESYRHAGLALRLPMWGGFVGWRGPIVDVPFVARHSRVECGEVRTRLGLPQDRPVVLASFGGLGIAGLDLAPLGRLAPYHVVSTGHALGEVGPVPHGVTLLEDQALYNSGVRYEDLVRSADVVVTKPGYGIIAECVASDTALVYTSRGRFAEYDVLVEQMPRFLRCHFITHDDLFAGRWTPSLDAVLAQPPPPERPATDGAVVAAAAILREAGLESAT
jgi:hypothetical protein